MATVRMKKGDKYADIYDSAETIRQAQLDGYSLCEKPKEENAKPLPLEENEPAPEKRNPGGGKRQ